MRLQLRPLLLSATVLLFAAPSARATYTIDEMVIAPAGGVMSGGALSLEFTVGETAVGAGSAGSISMACGFWEGVAISDVAAAPDEPLPAAFAMWSGGPNPFSSGTLIRYAIPKGDQVPVFLGIYDVRGALVRTLVDEPREAGTFSVPWNGRNDHGELMGAGVYFAKLRAGTFRQVQRVVMLR